MQSHVKFEGVYKLFGAEAAVEDLNLTVEAGELLDFYHLRRTAYVEWNRLGTPLVEMYAQIVLRKMLTPFATGYVDLQSPAGAGISALVYNYDGKVFASDEGRMLAEMGDKTQLIAFSLATRYRRLVSWPHRLLPARMIFLGGREGMPLPPSLC